MLARGVSFRFIKPWRVTSVLSSRRFVSESQAVEEHHPPVPTVTIKSSLKRLPISLDKVEKDAKLLRKILKVEDFGLEIHFVGERKMRSINRDWREIDKSTDVLSFPVLEFTAPEKFRYKRKDFAGFILGEIIFELEYINKRMFKDKTYFEENGKYDDELDAGVSKELARTFDLSERVSLLLIHSMLHLLGYDHETDEDFAIMTKKEDEIIKKFYEARNKTISNSSDTTST